MTHSWQEFPSHPSPPRELQPLSLPGGFPPTAARGEGSCRISQEAETFPESLTFQLSAAVQGRVREALRSPLPPSCVWGRRGGKFWNTGRAAPSRGREDWASKEKHLMCQLSLWWPRGATGAGQGTRGSSALPGNIRSVAYAQTGPAGAIQDDHTPR